VDRPDQKIDGRISSLETSVASLATDVREIVQSIDRLRGYIGETQRPQWGNLISATGLCVVIVSAIGSAWINPLSISLQYHEKLSAERSVLVERLQDRLRDLEGDFKAHRQTNENEFKFVNSTIEDVRKNGSGVTRERLAVIESQIKERNHAIPIQ
jgi:hypothetical protein